MHFDHGWSEFVTLCSSFSFCLLGIWIIKEQSLKGAFSFSISPVLYFSERSVVVVLLCKFIWSRRRCRAFPISETLKVRSWLCQKPRLSHYLLVYILVYVCIWSWSLIWTTTAVNELCTHESWKDAKLSGFYSFLHQDSHLISAMFLYRNSLETRETCTHIIQLGHPKHIVRFWV